jgi:hypothetical protein
LRAILTGKKGRLALAVAAVYLVASLATLLFLPDPRRWAVLAVLLLFVPALLAVGTIASFLALFLHELGHVLAGKLVGFPWQSMTVGFLQIRPEKRRIRFSRSKMTSFSGFALCRIVGERRLRERVFVFTAGGPVATLLTIGLAFAMYRHANEAKLEWPVVASQFYWFFSFMLLMSGFSTLLGSIYIFGKKGADADFAILWRLARGGAKGSRHVAMALIASQSNAGVLPRDWDVALLEAAMAPKDLTPSRIQALVLCAIAEMDKGNLARAKELIDEAAVLEPKLHEIYARLKRTVRMEQAFLCAVLDDPKRSRELLRAACESLEDTEVYRLRTEAAIAYAEGQIEDGDRLRATYEEGFRAKGDGIDPKFIEAEIGWLDPVRDRFAGRESPTALVLDPV